MVSDSKEIRNQNINDALEKAIQILGSNDIYLLKYITGFLGNISVENLNVKVLLF